MKQHRALRRGLGLLLGLVMCLSLLPVTALAASDPGNLVFDISEGSVVIDEGTETGTIKVTYGNDQVKDGISPSEAIIVTGSFKKAEGNEAAHQLSVNTSANIIARDLTIDNTDFTGCSAMSVTGEAADVTLSLEGENTFTAGTGSPCIVVCNDSTLTIAGDGSVTAQGGDLYGSAGIIAVYGDIIISGGTVNAIGGETEIEGSIAKAISVSYGSMSITGGTVNATGGTMKGVSGESTGILASEADIIITGGKVNATGEDIAADEDHSMGINVGSGSITISGGEVNATGGDVTGNNCRSWGIRSSNSDLKMSNGKVNATGGAVTGENSQSGGIYAAGDIVINGGTVEAAGGAATGKDGISSGIYADGDITVSDTADVTARGGDILLADDAGDEETAILRESFGIYANTGDVTINGGTLKAAGGNNAAWSMGINSRGTGKVTVNGGTLNAAGGDAKYTAMQSCAVSYGISGGELTVNGGAVTVTGGDANGYYPESLGVTVGQATITGGTVTAEGGAATAKWGSATSCAISSSEKLEISGGMVTAEGGSAAFDPETTHYYGETTSSFGIRSWRAIEISGGTVEAAGGAADTESNGIKIKYNFYPDSGEFDGGYLSVSGGEVKATGGAADDSVGIRTTVYRYDLDTNVDVKSGTIAITGGRVTARTLAGEDGLVRMAMCVAPSLPDVYCWRTAETGAFTASTTPYTFSYGHTYVEFIAGFSFVDVPASAYYFDAVLWAVDNGITAGTSDTTFSPDAPCTRAQIVAFLWRAAGRPEPTTTNNPFTDVKADDYYYKAVLWAVENKIVYGIDETTFGPNLGCTRGQVAAFLWRAAGRPEPTTTNNPFHDVDTSKYYGKAVVWAAENKIVYGTSATEFSPDAICTRAQIVSFLYRYMK